MLKEWRGWLNETKPTDKYFGEVPRQLSDISPKDQKYNRAITSAMGQKDFRSTFKVWLGQFLITNYGDGNMEFLISKMSEEDKAQAVRDLNIMRYIYSGKSKFDIYNTDNIKTGVMYNNQPEVKGSAVEKIDSILNDIGEKFNVL